MSILIKELSKSYNSLVALHNINLSIKKGVFGLLGKNGAGKTTLMRILATLLEPSSGIVEIYDISLHKKNHNEIKSMIGYLPQEFGFYENLTVYEAMDYMGILNKMNTSVRKERIDYMLSEVNLNKERQKKIRQLSGGMKRRLGIAQAMLHEPRILIIDEPTAGVDPEERIGIRNMLSNFAQDRTILLSTHIVEDIASTCQELAILDEGKQVYCGSSTSLISSARGHVWTCRLESQEQLMNLKQHHLVISQNHLENGIEVRFVNIHQHELRGDYSEVTPSLEDAYMFMIKGGSK
ncbi:ABC transporter ATP-binding protein [Paenibacillus tritici]|uniref:ABC transporter ATP-binding protein n=1 Tax=Paenibacillus tritici TaxID=1873425 RepID=UPI001BA93314|nr:ABC transporter ATP-binding protein [Paenibacillus tritici]QUL56262.1 ABC transporter ATP-binding protein [Paenibacillus tritici]